MSTLARTDSDTSGSEDLALAYGAFLRLGWTPQWSFPQRLAGTSRMERKGAIDLIIVDAFAEGLRFTCALPDGTEGTTGMQRDKEAAFLPVLEELRASASSEERATWHTALEQLGADTRVELARQEAEQSALGEAMRYRHQGYWVTYGLIALNVLVFIAMVIAGAGIFEPKGEALLTWGANFAPYTLGGQPWRLLSACFVHIGILHLALNMYGLYQLGTFLEPILGRLRFVLAYLATGLLSSLASLWWHHGEPVVSAGASGAIFGLFGLFLALLTTDLLPKNTREQLLKSVGLVIVINLAYGLKGGIDNSAHIGGLVSGFAAGYALLPSLRRKTPGTGIAAGLLVIAFVFCAAFVATHHDNRLRWEEQEARLVDFEKRGMAPMQPDPAGMLHLPGAAKAWDSARAELSAASYPLPPDYSRRRDLMRQYVDLRVREIGLLQRQFRGEPGKVDSLQSIGTAIDTVLQQLNTKQE
ncbi:MAG: rhomboid family intramembrane serine protease [Chitinophagaceae bacterium]|nr:MAG: rhomboid family intramembrane serine protease [Chitinophagaceae bacterium]